MKKDTKRIARLLRLACAALCALALTITGTYALSVEEAIQILEIYYVDELPDEAYEAETLDELFEILGDPYTYYMSAQDYDEFADLVESENEITGIGAVVDYRVNGIFISALLEGGGAGEAGIVPGDTILAIDGISCAPADTAHRDLILGEEGSHVTLTILHADGTEEDIDVERHTVHIHNTMVTSADGITTIDCDSFGSLTALYFHGGILDHDAETDVWVVDLRSNTGGLTDASVNALGLFTGFGIKIFYTDHYGVYDYLIYPDEALTEKPVIVLVDDYTASASELFAGDIRAENGIVIGTRTYGKGVSQAVFDENDYPELFDGDSLKVTTYRFFCSDGNTTDKIGVFPTLLVESDAGEIAALLSVTAPEEGTCISLSLNHRDYYIDLAKAQSEQYQESLTELLAALPPDVTLTLSAGSQTEELTPEEALSRYGDSAASRLLADAAESPFANEINTLAVYDIVAGDDDSLFHPEESLSRAELCEMLARTIDVQAMNPPAFSDVAPDSWYAGSVGAMSIMGIMRGCGDGTFQPDALLTQEQFITVLGRFAAFLNFQYKNYIDQLTEEELTPFDNFSDWSRSSIAALRDAIDPMFYTDPADVEPNAPVTREQAAAALCLTLKAAGHICY